MYVIVLQHLPPVHTEKGHFSYFSLDSVCSLRNDKRFSLVKQGKLKLANQKFASQQIHLSS